LQVVRLTGHLNSITKSTYGAGIQVAKVGDDIVMGRTEMLCLIGRLCQTRTHHLQHLAVLGEFRLQVQYTCGIAQGIALQLTTGDQKTAQGFKAKTQIGNLAINAQGVWWVEVEQALNTGFIGIAGYKAGACQLLNQCRCLQYACGCEGNILPVFSVCHEILKIVNDYRYFLSPRLPGRYRLRKTPPIDPG